MPGLIRVPSAGSTMDLLHGLAADGAAAGTVVVAGEQTGARGSRGRSWHAPPGGLWLSVLYRPALSVGVELFGLRLGLAVAEAIEALGPGTAVDIKWPNDLMVGDRKLGGILCEARWQGDSLAWVAAGIGINVSNPVPRELAGIAISLSERLPGIALGLVETEVTARLRAVSQPAARLDPAELAGLRRRDWLCGRRLRGPADGTAAGIDEEGALLVRSDGGTVVAVRAGTVELADHSLRP
jgi:BirA family biotin operon repressor/biotin-[acetyl-CoA-carboxylase] ligase